MSKNYGIVRLDLVEGHAHHYAIDVAIENGLLGEVNHATGKLVAATAANKELVLVASVEVLYDSVDVSDFRNEPNTFKVRAFTLDKGDIFTTTQIDLSGDRKTLGAIVKGDYAAAVAGGKFAFTTAASTTANQVFVVEEVTSLNGYPAVALKVVKA